MGKSIQDILQRMEIEIQRKIQDEQNQLEEARRRQREEYLRRTQVPLYVINPYSNSLSIPISTGGRRKTIGTIISFVGGLLVEAPFGPINGSNKVFILSFVPDPGSEHIYLNGLLQTYVINYDMGVQSVTFINPPEPGDIITVSYRVDEG